MYAYGGVRAAIGHRSDSVRRPLVATAGCRLSTPDCPISVRGVRRPEPPARDGEVTARKRPMVDLSETIAARS